MITQEAVTDAQIEATFDVVSELRPHLAREEYLTTVRRMMDGGYRMVAALDDAGEVRAVAGFRYVEMLARGRSVYVDDLVTAASHRSAGYGEALFARLHEIADELGCSEFHLDSGVQRGRAHRFYFREGMQISSYHFAMSVRSATAQPTG